MVDKVRALKIENPANGGTDLDMFPTEVKVNQDYLAAKGISFENTDVDYVDLSTDNNPQGKTFAASLLNRNFIPDNGKNYVVSADLQYINFDEIIIDGTLTLNGSLVIIG